VIAYSAGSALIGSPRGDSVWLFALDGKLPPATAGQPMSRLEGAANPAPAAANPAPAAATPGSAAAAATAAMAAANLVRGKELYEQACVVCHGADGKGGHGVGAPLIGVADFAAVFRTVGEGRNNMPPFKASFTSEQIRDVTAYVVSALGRPQ
jgi:mono/diheme cytochrome c family protein